MSEEEIIKKANELLVRVTSGYRLAMVDNVDLVLQALLDLYNKQKEEIEKYKKYYETEKVVWSRNDYISKDKIKEKIKTLVIGKNDDWNDECFTEGRKKEAQIAILKKLLEEGDK